MIFYFIFTGLTNILILYARTTVFRTAFRIKFNGTFIEIASLTLAIIIHISMTIDWTYQTIISIRIRETFFTFIGTTFTIIHLFPVTYKRITLTTISRTDKYSMIINGINWIALLDTDSCGFFATITRITIVRTLFAL